MSHTCHATGCAVEVPPEMFSCRRHWFMLPKALRDRIWATYRPGQCDDWRISHEYANAAREAVRYLAAREGREPDTKIYDMLDPKRYEDENGERGTPLVREATGCVPSSGTVQGGGNSPRSVLRRSEGRELRGMSREVETELRGRLSLRGSTERGEPVKTPYQSFCDRWGKGCGSGLCEGASRIVLCRGTLPCDVLFVGEAPGVSEDALGRPFVGPAGKLLDWIIEQAMPADVQIDETGNDVVDLKFRVAYTNLVGCLPRNPDGRKASEPLPEEIEECAPRLEEFVRKVAKPRLIVCVGDHAHNWIMGYKGKTPSLLADYEAARVHVVHPAAILRANAAQRGLMRQRAVAILRVALERL